MNKKIYLGFIIFSIILISTTGIVFAKYIAIVSSNISTTQIAEPILVVNKTTNSSNTTVSASSSVEYTVSVSNYNASKTSEIAEKYYLEIYSDNVDLSKLTITVKKDNSNITLTNYKTTYYEFKANTKETHNFVINISNKSGNTTALSGNIKIRVVGEQLEPAITG